MKCKTINYGQVCESQAMFMVTLKGESDSHICCEYCKDRWLTNFPSAIVMPLPLDFVTAEVDAQWKQVLLCCEREFSVNVKSDLLIKVDKIMRAREGELKALKKMLKNAVT